MQTQEKWNPTIYLRSKGVTCRGSTCIVVPGWNGSPQPRLKTNGVANSTHLLVLGPAPRRETSRSCKHTVLKTTRSSSWQRHWAGSTKLGQRKPDVAQSQKPLHLPNGTALAEDSYLLLVFMCAVKLLLEKGENELTDTGE